MNKSEKFWDGTAEKYAKSPISDELSYQRKLSETQSLFTPDMQVLEFGCGTGSTAIAHAPFVKHIDAIDLSENMLAIGREKAVAANVSNIDFTRATLEEFNGQASSFDAVLGLSVVHLLPDRRASFAEVLRILKPGGFFVSSTVCLGNSFLRYIKLIAPLGKWLGLMPDVFVFSEADLVSEITEAGFAIETHWHHGKNGIVVFVIARKV